MSITITKFKPPTKKAVLDVHLRLPKNSERMLLHFTKTGRLKSMETICKSDLGVEMEHTHEWEVQE